MCLGYALLGWLQSHSPEHSFWNQMYTLFLFVGVMCAIIHYGSRAIKNRITYPRTVWWKWAVVAAMTCGSFVLALIPARVLGSLIAGSPVNRHYPAPLLTMLMTTTLYGCLLTVSGGISFWLYLHHTQTPEPEAR